MSLSGSNARESSPSGIDFDGLGRPREEEIRDSDILVSRGVDEPSTTDLALAATAFASPIQAVQIPAAPVTSPLPVEEPDADKTQQLGSLGRDALRVVTAQLAQREAPAQGGPGHTEVLRRSDMPSFTPAPSPAMPRAHAAPAPAPRFASTPPGSHAPPASHAAPASLPPRTTEPKRSAAPLLLGALGLVAVVTGTAFATKHVLDGRAAATRPTAPVIEPYPALVEVKPIEPPVPTVDVSSLPATTPAMPAHAAAAPRAAAATPAPAAPAAPPPANVTPVGAAAAPVAETVAAPATGMFRVTDPSVRVIRVDGNYRKLNGGSVELPCGPHKIAIGMSTERVDVPCGGTVTR